MAVKAKKQAVRLSTNSRCDDIKALKKAWFSRFLLMGDNLIKLAKMIEFHIEPVDLLELDKVDYSDLPVSMAKRILKKQSEKFAHSAVSITEKDNDNLQRVKQMFGFNTVEMQLLIFVSHLKTDPVLEQCFESGDSDISDRQLIRYLQSILHIPEAALLEGIHKQGRLAKTGLLKINHSPGSIPDKFNLLDGIGDLLIGNSTQSIDEVFANYVAPAKPAQLTGKNFDYIASAYARIASYLEQVINQRQTGCNILIYGQPGTGKTEMVRSIAAELDSALYEVSVEDAEGDILSGKARISACQLAQFLLQGESRNSLLFDETEDIFARQDHLFGA